MLKTTGFHRIFHPSDFSEASGAAFAHALRLALAMKSELTILHIGNATEDTPWSEFPRVRQTLERWNILPAGSPKEAIAGLGLHIQKVALPHADPARSIIHYLERHPHDLTVLATHQRDGLDRWLHEQVAEPVARHSPGATLFVPPGGAGFVSAADGSTHLRRILAPVDRLPDPKVALHCGATVAAALRSGDAEATAFYVGDEAEFPEIPLPGALKWEKACGRGDVASQILETANTRHADLIVMATMGHQGFLDALRGSTTERVLRHARCPVLAVPAQPAPEPINATVEGLASGSLAVSL